MTDRERWTVYPLLFLAMGMAMRDNILELVDVDNVHCKALRCNTLVVSDPKGERQLVIPPASAGVLLCNALVVADSKGRQQVVVSANEGGGVMQTAGTAGRPDVIVGHSKRVSGLMFVDTQGKLLPGSIFAPAVAAPDAPTSETPDAAPNPGSDEP